MTGFLKHFLKLLLPLLIEPLSWFRIRRKPVHPQRILILAAGYLGDTFWAVQTVRILRAAFPDAELFLAARSPFLDPLAHGLLDPAHRIPLDAIISDRTREHFSVSALIGSLRRVKNAGPDLVFDLMDNRYSALFSFLIRAYAIGLDLDPEFARLYSFCASQSQIPGPHLALRPRSIVRQFLSMPDTPNPDMIPPVPALSRSDIFRKLGLPPDGKPVLLVPGAGWSAKQWPPDRFRILAQRLEQNGCTVVVSGSNAESALCRGIVEGLASAKILTGAIPVVISLLPHCLLCVGGDTGIIHIAEAFNIPCISLYCNTNPAFHLGLTKSAKCLQASCQFSPLPHEKFCRLGPLLTCSRPECMNISPDQVLALIPGFHSRANR